MDLRVELKLVFPEIVVCFTIAWVLLGDLVLGGDDEYEEVRASDFVSLIGLMCALAVTLRMFPQGSSQILWQSLVIDQFSQYVKLLLLIASFFAVLLAYRSPEVTTYRRAEYVSYVLTLLLGGMLVASANDLVTLYLGFEMLGVPSYILAGHMRGSVRSSEAGFKYVLYGAASSGVLLFGLTYLYGMTGSIRLDEICRSVAMQVAGAARPEQGIRVIDLGVLPVPILMVLVGMLYKVAAFPLHFWCPDVYEGSPMPVTALFSVVPKIGGFAVLIRFLYTFAGALEVGTAGVAHAAGSPVPIGYGAITGLLATISAFTMSVGNLSALNQTNIKRLLAYSSIANAGYLLMGVAIFDLDRDVEGIMAVLFFLAVYVFANLGAWVVAVAVADHLGEEEIDGYAGLGRIAPWAGVSMAIFLFSLVGIPPLAGFIGKFFLFYAVIQKGLFWLAIVGLANSVISLFYYARILEAMFLKEAPEGTTFELADHYRMVIALLVVPVVVLGVWFGPLTGVAQAAATTFKALP